MESPRGDPGYRKIPVRHAAGPSRRVHSPRLFAGTDRHQCPVRPCSCHRADGLAKLRQRDAEEDKPDHRESDELRPYDVQSRAAIENGLGQQDEMGRGGCQHHCLDESGPALDQGVSMLAMIAPSLSRSLADKGSSAAHPATRHLMRQTRH